MELNFIKINPSGNTTVLILDPLPREVYSRVASKVMKPTSLSAEQVGFVERATLSGALGRLEMMGGEFCGNASRGFAAWLTDRQDPGLSLNEGTTKVVVPIEVSGHQGILKATVARERSDRRAYYVEISMPLPRWLRQKPDYTLVDFEGIVHAVVWGGTASEARFQAIKKEVSRELGEVDCLGVMFYQEEVRQLTPVVYVRSVGSLVWESSCGSGSVAVAAALAERERRSVKALNLAQPGGIIQADVEWQNHPVEARIGGDVIIEAGGVVYVDL